VRRGKDCAGLKRSMKIRFASFIEGEELREPENLRIFRAAR
jgi:hypothetical protein